MTCPYCKKKNPLRNPKFCPNCGHSLENIEAQFVASKRHRGNGAGSAVRKPDGTYMARATICIDNGSDKLARKEKTKSGFSTKTEAYEAAIQLRKQLESEVNGDDRTSNINEGFPTIEELWELFSTSSDFSSLGASMQNRYKYAFKKWEAVANRSPDALTLEELQKAVNANAKTYYPARDMKDLMSQLYELANQKPTVSLNNIAKKSVCQRKMQSRPSTLNPSVHISSMTLSVSGMRPKAVTARQASFC